MEKKRFLWFKVMDVIGSSRVVVLVKHTYCTYKLTVIIKQTNKLASTSELVGKPAGAWERRVGGERHYGWEGSAHYK